MDQDVAAQNLFVPSLAGIYRSLAPWGYAFIRFSAGAIVMYHGYAKLFTGFAGVVAERILTPMGFPAPLACAYWLGILELFGAAMMAVGLFTRPIAFMLAVEMAIITFGWQFKFGYFFSAQGGGYEFPLLLMLVYIGIVFRGGGCYSLDRLLGKEF